MEQNPKKRAPLSRKTKLIIVGSVAAVFIGFLIFVLTSSATFTRQPDENLDFSRVIRDNVHPDVRVVDIAMLGAHNAFTDSINRHSDVCPHDDNMLTNPAVVAIAPGMLTRFLQCQKSDATGLLMRGVRYFDIRLTYIDGGWYAHHSLISAPLSDYLVQIIDFLAQNPGEIIIFHMQHIRLGSASFEDLWEFIASVRSSGYTLFDFVNFDPYNTPLGELTKGQATEHGAAAIIIARKPAYEGGFHYDHHASMHSTWHNQIRTNALIADIQREYEFLRQNPDVARDMFRVSQAQTTPNFSGFGNIMYTLFSWSVLSHNASHNVTLLNHESFSDWLSLMPIFMVDFADSPRGNFNVYVMDKINEFNRNLRG